MHKIHRNLTWKPKMGKNTKALIYYEELQLERFKSVHTTYRHFSKTSLQWICAQILYINHYTCDSNLGFEKNMT